VDAHGGYLLQTERLDLDLTGAARLALLQDGQDPRDTSLLVSALTGGKVIRIAYDAPFTYGKKGAQWYRMHHALALILSSLVPLAVHAYVFDPDEMEGVTAYREGRKVGGDFLSYDTVDFPVDGKAKLDDVAYEKMLASWPLGRLARIYGVPRSKLLALPRAQGVLMNLDESSTGIADAGTYAEGRIKAS
jgi:hypothetical protein